MISDGVVPSDVVAIEHSQPSRCLNSIMLTGTLSTSSPKSEKVGLQTGLIPPVVAQIISSSAGASGSAGLNLLKSTPASSCNPLKASCGITVNLPIIFSSLIFCQIFKIDIQYNMPYGIITFTYSLSKWHTLCYIQPPAIYLY